MHANRVFRQGNVLCVQSEGVVPDAAPADAPITGRAGTRQARPGCKVYVSNLSYDVAWQVHLQVLAVYRITRQSRWKIRYYEWAQVHSYSAVVLLCVLRTKLASGAHRAAQPHSSMVSLRRVTRLLSTEPCTSYCHCMLYCYYYAM
jgi:hypothetical protein